ncbi:hypothetical protein J7J58_02460, partial [candidate division WOR-3 bacterium]|nr:hypothetical protein [candidate division WOR-3 bacterium]
KDTDKFLKSGISDVAFWGKDGYILYSRNTVDLNELIARYIDFDFIIIEGGKHVEELPKVWIGAPDSGIKNIVALITGEEKKWNIPTFKRKNISSLVSFLLSL